MKRLNEIKAEMAKNFGLMRWEHGFHYVSNPHSSGNDDIRIEIDYAWFAYVDYYVNPLCLGFLKFDNNEQKVAVGLEVKGNFQFLPPLVITDYEDSVFAALNCLSLIGENRYETIDTNGRHILNSASIMFDFSRGGVYLDLLLYYQSKEESIKTLQENILNTLKYSVSLYKDDSLSDLLTVEEWD